MKKTLCTVIFLLFSAIPVFANNYLDSLYMKYHAAKTDTAKYNLLHKIIYEYVEIESDNHNPEAIAAILDKTIEELRIKKDDRRFESFLHLKATACYYTKKYDPALRYADSCIQIAEKYRDYNELGQLYRTKQLVYSMMNLGGRSVQSLYKAIEFFKKAGNVKSQANSLFSLGNFYLVNKQNDLALKTYLLSANVYTSVNDSVSAGMGWLFAAGIVRQTGNLKLAEEYIRKGRPVIHSPLIFQPYYYYFYYGKWLKAMNRNAEALDCFKIAAPLAVKGNQRYQKAAALSEMAEIYLDEKKLGKAKQMLDEAKVIAYEEGYLLPKIKVSRVFSEYYEATGEQLLALKEYKTWQSLKDSIDQNELSRSLSSAVLEAEYNKKDAERAEEQRKKDEAEAQKLRNQKIIAGSTGGVLFFVGIVAFLLYRSNRQHKKANTIIAAEKQHSEDLLHNILPAEVAIELKATGASKAKDFREVTVLFTDFKNFTAKCEQLTAQQLVNEIHFYYSAFDKIITRYGIEKIKTIGDSYMCAGGLPVETVTNPEDTVQAALEMRDFVLEEKEKRMAAGSPCFEIRIGLHTGPVVAGIVGIKKFAYDIWGDTVNIAARMESCSEPGQVNISGATYALVKEKFHCIHRGKIQAKNKGEIDMYFVVGKF
jgi:adenylate cyclase